MGKEELQELFCAKIGIEMENFKRNLLNQSAETVYAHAYQIDSIINIYEILLEMQERLEKNMLAKLMMFPSLLEFIYERWLEKEDSHAAELGECIRESIATV